MSDIPAPTDADMRRDIADWYGFACEKEGTDSVPAVAIRRALAAERVAAERVGGDPELRDLLLYEFGTTEPELLREMFAERRAKQS